MDQLSEQFRLQQPDVSLPKGGGAIRAISENFSSNPVTATAGLSVALPVSNGRGFVPSPSLGYDSGGGQGAFGLGWSVGLGSIRRHAGARLPSYVDDEDLFVLSGMELVPITEGALAGPREIVEEGETWRVFAYRGRVAGDFTRIEHWRAADGTSHWRSWSGANVVVVYGQTAQAQIADPAAPERIHEWLVERSFDALGNVIAYGYKAEDLAGVGSTACAAERQSSTGPQAQRYPKWIGYNCVRPYNGETLSPEAFTCLLLFDYGEHDDTHPTLSETRAWSLRSDAFSDRRAGFEVRTRRLCRRVIRFHKFDDASPQPIDGIDIAYLAPPGEPALVSAVQACSFVVPHLAERERTMPPVRFEYSSRRFVPTLAAEATQGFGDGWRLDSAARWCDLDGDGLTDRIYEVAGSRLAAKNNGRGCFSPPKSMIVEPTLAGLGVNASLGEPAADGQMALVSHDAEMSGHFYVQDAGGFAPFQASDRINASSEGWVTLQDMDLLGTGVAGLLACEGDRMVFFPKAGPTHFGDPVTVRLDALGVGGARIFGDANVALFLADMTGDGLADIVRADAGSVQYWPNLGRGRFGTPIEMADPPRFDRPDSFDPGAVRLSDLDGSGGADLIYLAGGKVRLWSNCQGNGWIAQDDFISPFPGYALHRDIELVDILGEGLPRLCWTDPIGGRLLHAPILVDGKPFLMQRIANSIGGETLLSYRTSTDFLVEDREGGHDWLTTPHFPIHCLSSVIRRDAVTGYSLAATYRYRHGYYDRAMREFRGFAFVETSESNEVATERSRIFVQPPVVTRQWFAVGLEARDAGALAALANEFYADPALDLPLPAIALEGAASAEEWLDGLHALKGVPLRSETWCLDGSDKAQYPLALSQTSWKAVRRQPRQGPIAPGRGGWAVFQPLRSESIDVVLDRTPGDPRIAHIVTLDWDEWGNPLREAAASYPRRVADERLPADVRAAQLLHHVGLLEMRYCAAIDHGTSGIPGAPGGPHAWRLPQAYETRASQLAGAHPSGTLWTRGELTAFAANAPEIDYSDTQATVGRRLLSCTRGYFLDDLLAGSLPLGEQGRLGLPYTQEALFATAPLLATLFGDKIDSALMERAGYRADAEGSWWTPGATPIHADDPAASFYQPEGVRDAFGNESRSARDRFSMLVESVTNPLGHQQLFVNDYHFLTPVLSRDANDNWSAAELDAFGRVVAAAQMGKLADGTLAATGHEACEGDNLDHPSAEFAVDPWSWEEGRGPSFVHARRYEDLYAQDPARLRVQELREHTGGFGQVVMAKGKTRPGPAQRIAADGTLETIDAPERWIGNGRTVFNSKGEPLRVFEPYFSATPAYEDDPLLIEQGASAWTFYDSVGRAIGGLAPDQTWTAARSTPWRGESWDAIDTLAIANPIDDPDLGGHFAALPEDSFRPGWAGQRMDGALGENARRAAEVALESAGTPTVSHTDALGRTILAVADNGSRGTAETRSLLDFEGNVLGVVDARGNRVVTQGFAMLPGSGDDGKRPLHVASMDAGESWGLPDVLGRAFCTWDGEGRRVESRYDALSRPTETLLFEPGMPPKRIMAFTYGDDALDAAARNLVGAPWRSWDQSAFAEIEGYDYRGNVLASARRFARSVGEAIDWPDDETAREALVEDERFVSTTSYDAMGRMTHAIAAHSEGSTPSESFLTYDEGGLAHVETQVPGGTRSIQVERIEYDAKGQRSLIRYGNGVETRYAYDPETWRLVRLTTERDDGSVLQDMAYTHDAVGNVVTIRDDAQSTVFFANAVVEPTAEFEYDALYRLVEASGREHIDQTGPPDWLQGANAMPHPQDGRRMRRYTQMYAYDAIGNILSMRHIASGGNWTRNYAYAAHNNRLLSTHLGGAQALPEHVYAYTAKGSFAGMAHLPGMTWNYAEQLVQIDRGTGETAHYSYGGDGQRVRKRRTFPGGRMTERLYLGGVEFYREYLGGVLKLERQSLHVMDDTGRIALIETQTLADGTPIDRPEPLTRYQLGNHIGSCSTELDEAGAVISHEEYHPYGTTACVAVTSAREVPPRRYRYTGKERDEESGLTYHGARYYAPWLARWTAADPGGMIDGVNWYAYVGGRPIGSSDPSGRNEEDQLVFRKTGAHTASTVFNSEEWGSIRDTLAQAKAGDSFVTATSGGTVFMIFAGNSGGTDDASFFFEGDRVYASHGSLKERYNRRSAEESLDALDVAHKVLDAAGLVPGLGEPADLLNGGIYLYEGQYGNAAISFGSAVGGDALKAARYVPGTSFVMSTAGNAIGGASSTLVAMAGLALRRRKGSQDLIEYGVHSLRYLQRGADSLPGLTTKALRGTVGQAADETTALLLNAVKRHRDAAGDVTEAAMGKNYAAAAFRVDGKLKVISAPNLPMSADEALNGLHSEIRILGILQDYQTKAQRSGQSFEVVQVFSERIPCSGCATAMWRSWGPLGRSRPSIFYAVEEKFNRAERLSAAYFGGG